MADKPKKIISDADYKRLMPKFRAHVISESAAKRLGLTGKTTAKTPPKAPPVKSVPPKTPEKPAKTPPEPKVKPSALKKAVVDDAPITISKGKRGATKWRKGNGPWRYDEPPAQHKTKPAEEVKQQQATPPKPPVAVPRTATASVAAPKSTPHGQVQVVMIKDPTTVTGRSGSLTWEAKGDAAGGASAHKLLDKLGPHVSRFVGEPFHAQIEFPRDSHITHGVLGHVEANGAFYATTGLIQLNSKLSAQPGHVEATLAHELGHALDFKVGAKFSIAVPPIPLSGLSPAAPLTDTVHDHLLPLARAMEGSMELKLLRDARRDPRTIPAAQRELNYLLEPTELFARAFAQWAVTKHGSPEAKAHLAKRPTSDQFGLLPTQWHKDEFKPIAREFDKLFG